MHKGYGTKLTREQRKEFKRCRANASKCFINFYLAEAEGGGFYLREEVKLWAYLTLFIPMHLLQFIHCLWDGGLKEFRILGRYIACDYLHWGSVAWKSANKILKTYEENKE